MNAVNGYLIKPIRDNKNSGVVGHDGSEIIIDNSPDPYRRGVVKGVVLSSPDDIIKAGDTIIFDFHIVDAFGNPPIDRDEDIWRVPEELAYFVIEEGGIRCLDGHLMVKRIYQDQTREVAGPDGAVVEIYVSATPVQKPEKSEVVYAPENNMGIKPGCIVYHYPQTDVPITDQMEEVRLEIVDVFAVDGEMISNFVLIRQDTLEVEGGKRADAFQKGGLVYFDKKTFGFRFGEVVDAGPDAEVSIGDRVIFDSAVKKVHWKGEDLHMTHTENGNYVIAVCN